MNLTRARIIAVCAVVAAIVVVLVLRGRESYRELPAEGVAVEEIGPGVQSVVLVFADRGASRVIEERREIVVPEDRASRAKRILSELAEGPKGGDAVGALPVGTKIRSVFFDDTGGAYVDFTRELVANHPGGSAGELFTIRSVVGTLAANFPDVERVTFLVEGEEIETIAGHIDAGVPFPVDQYR